ncbi:MAG: MoaD family protein [Hadesarchaea archaeon]|nr:MoaD family protein [Hadesarchaea archaeon]
MVKVKFFASFREAVGKKKLEIKSIKNVDDLLKKLVKKFGSDLKKKIYKSKKNELRDNVNILINGKSMNSLEGLETKLEEDDVIAIFPPVSGG